MYIHGLQYVGMYLIGYILSHQRWRVCVIGEPQVLNTTASSYLPRWQTLINLPGAGCLWSRRQAAQVEASALHLAWLKSAIPPNVGNSGVQFLVVGDCVRAIPWQNKRIITKKCVFWTLSKWCVVHSPKQLQVHVQNHLPIVQLQEGQSHSVMNAQRSNYKHYIVATMQCKTLFTVYIDTQYVGWSAMATV